MKFSFHDIPVIGIDGELAEESDLHNTLAAVLYRSAKNLDLVDIALQINRGEEVELEKAELAEVKTHINDPSSGLYAFARKALKGYIESVEKAEKGKEDAKS